MLNSAHSFARIYALVCVNLRTRLRYSAHSFALFYAVVCCICHPLGLKNPRLQASKYSPVPWPSIRSATRQSVRFLQSMVYFCPRSWQPRPATPVHLGAARQDSTTPAGYICPWRFICLCSTQANSPLAQALQCKMQSTYYRRRLVWPMLFRVQCFPLCNRL